MNRQNKHTDKETKHKTRNKTEKQEKKRHKKDPQFRKDDLTLARTIDSE